jgi:hypothetical protein
MPTHVDFWDLVSPEPNTGCSLWLGACSHSGYARYGPGRANRYALEQKLGRKLLRTEQAAHKCDTPSCVNADHLFAATSQQNSDDKVAKNRQAKGESLRLAQAKNRPRGDLHGMSKLTEAQRTEISSRYAKEKSPGKLAKEYGVDRTRIWQIARKRP